MDRVQVILTNLGYVEDRIFKDRNKKDLEFKEREKRKKKNEKKNSSIAPKFVPQGAFAPTVSASIFILDRLLVQFLGFECIICFYKMISSQCHNQRKVIYFTKAGVDHKNIHFRWGPTEGLCAPPITVWNQFFRPPRGSYLRN